MSKTLQEKLDEAAKVLKERGYLPILWQTLKEIDEPTDV